MRAVVITRPGGPEVLELREVVPPVAGEGEILVRVRAAGVNRADVLQRDGRYPAPPGVPADIPGLEYAGEVSALGPGVTRWRGGDRVMGLVAGGAYAEYVTTHEATALAIPPSWSFDEAGAVPEVFGTAYDALIRQMRLTSGERVLIQAVGSGVGTAALQIAKAFGATVIGVSRSPEKLERARRLGLDVAIDASRESMAEAVQRETGGAGADVVLDLIGGPRWGETLAALAPRGRLILVGLTAGRRAEVDLGMILSKRLSIVGTTLRARPLAEKVALAEDFARDVLPLFAGGRMRPVVDRVFPMAAAADAHRRMESDAHFGKLVLNWREPPA